MQGSTEVHNSDEIVGKRYSFTATLSTYHRLDHGAAFMESQRDLATRIAREVCEDRKFFAMTSEHCYMKIRCSCIVLTEQEYADLLLHSFRNGVNHALSFGAVAEPPR